MIKFGDVAYVGDGGCNIRAVLRNCVGGRAPNDIGKSVPKFLIVHAIKL